VVEPIQGEGGVRVPDAEYIEGLRKLADENDLLLIFDEVWTGCGRTGEVFAYQHWGVEPDIMTLGKAVGCGLALGVTCVADRWASYFNARHMERVTHATTLGGNCVTAAVSARMFEILERDDMPERAAKAGEISERVDAHRRARPAAVAVDDKRVLLRDMSDPAGARGEIGPGAVLERRHRTVEAAPVSAGAGGDDMTLPVHGIGRRRGVGAALHREKRQGVKRAQGFVDGDVLLRLSGREIGQGEVRRGQGHGPSRRRRKSRWRVWAGTGPGDKSSAIHDPRRNH